MKKLITFICISLFCIFSLTAQEKKGGEKIKALKIAYLTEQLNLTSTEAEKFWPIYNIYSKEQHDLRNAIRTEMKNAIKKSKDDIKLVSENEAERIIKFKLTTDKKIYESEKNFITKIKNIISYKKIMQLQIAEMEFGRKLMKKYRLKKKGAEK
ncbi:MAG: sensor of ECF-type sigma factor [Polaribacter sp.]|uniref:sensor of ECF-type sigma factor n=1 Tax=Polaribacter sp. TaxID=1920175 RepID=UPI0032648823